MEEQDAPSNTIPTLRRPQQLNIIYNNRPLFYTQEELSNTYARFSIRPGSSDPILSIQYTVNGYADGSVQIMSNDLAINHIGLEVLRSPIIRMVRDLLDQTPLTEGTLLKSNSNIEGLNSIIEQSIRNIADDSSVTESPQTES
ncbi:hypothetical protein KC669_05140 [Candidatus Dojkabacteria bacterium]|uniref:Uncharacterized protein n=1 Tax=Candidatus Dojkabacteria bacterium TaxID=2099670 RepID=A0A955LC26_9BACT|nr:hypothetical protein [Candidatus Dojkabacteria bacterium]